MIPNHPSLLPFPTRASILGSEQTTAQTSFEQATEPTIVFTGDRRNDRFRILVKGKAVELCRVGLNILIDLVIARADSRTGFLRACPVSVCRLRQALDESLGPGGGKGLIETGGAKEYRLTILPQQLGVALAIEACFVELVELKVVSLSRASQLLQLGSAV